MINFAKSRIDRSVERKVALANLITAEGKALVADFSVANSVKLSLGTSADVFAGISLSQQLTPEILPWVDSYEAEYQTFTLTHTPLSNTLRVIGEDGTTLTAGNPSNANEYSISGKVITINVSRADTVITARYRFEPTALQAKFLQGDIPPGGAAGLLLNSVGVILAGDIYTSEFDTAADWSGTPVLRMQANGLFTSTSAGGNLAVPGGRVISVPSADDMFLGISLNNG